MYRIRSHGRGGQGVDAVAQTLGTLFPLRDLEAQGPPCA